MALAEQKARTIRRAVVNKAKNFTVIETKVREATSNDPWGPETTLLHEIADASYNVVAFGEIMNVLWKRINDDGKNWRHVMKSLTVLECLVKSGSGKCSEQCKKNIYAIETLSTFQHIDKDGKDMGHVVREKAKNLVALLKDDERLRSEREKAAKLREKMSATTVWSLSSSGQRNTTSGTTWRPTYPSEERAVTKTTTTLPTVNTTRAVNGSASANIARDMENALPTDATEEELQLQLALALSKEEAEKEESQRKNADIRFQLALEESKKEDKKRKESLPNSDLLSLNLGASSQPTLKEQAKKAMTVSAPGQPNNAPFDPWGHPSPIANNADPFGVPTNDPFGGLPVAHELELSAYPNLFSNTSSDMPAPLMPMSSANDGVNFGAANISDTVVDDKFTDRPDSPTKQVAESFLGDHAKLVNFDNLITPTRPAAGTEIFPTANPFSGNVPARGNPFQPAKTVQPSINELRNQQNQEVLRGNSASNGFGVPPQTHTMFNSNPSSFTQINPQPMQQFNAPPSVPAFPSQFMDPNPAPPPFMQQDAVSLQQANNDFNPFR